MAVHQRLDQRRVDPYGAGLRKRGSLFCSAWKQIDHYCCEDDEKDSLQDERIPHDRVVVFVREEGSVPHVRTDVLVRHEHQRDQYRHANGK